MSMNQKPIGTVTGLIFEEYMKGLFAYDKDSDTCIYDMSRALEADLLKVDPKHREATFDLSDFKREVCKDAFYAGMAAMKGMQKEIEAIEA